MSGEKPQSQNPFEYGDNITRGLAIHFVSGVSGDMVSLKDTDSDQCTWFHFRRLLSDGWHKAPPRKWEDLTAENWRERQGMGVWMRDIPGGEAFILKLVWFEPSLLHPFIGIRKSNCNPTKYRHASIYNDDGKEARWEE